MNSDERDAPNWAAPAETDHGGRVELRLVQGAPSLDAAGSTVTELKGAWATYQARWFTGDAQWSGAVTVHPPPPEKKSPAVRVTAPDDLPEWLAQFTETLVKTTARTAEREGNRWPRRLTRWRGEPKRSGEQ